MEHKLWIDGKWVDSKGGGVMAVENPAIGKKIAEVVDASPEDVNLAVEAAQRALQSGNFDSSWFQRVCYDDVGDCLSILSGATDPVSGFLRDMDVWRNILFHLHGRILFLCLWQTQICEERMFDSLCTLIEFERKPSWDC